MLKKLFRPKESVDMTQGKILPLLISFAIPLLVGNLFQQFYNMVDTWVVGNFASNEAFSAVGSVGSIINMIIGFFVGLSTGTSVVISQYFGAGKEEEIRRTVQTAAVMTLAVGALLTVIGIALTPLMLTLMKTPENVFPEARAYLTVYFSGILSLVIYNMGAGILRAIGDSRRPLYFLIVTSLVNIVLDLILVRPMGVRGVALATVIAQTVSAMLVIVTLFRTRSAIRLSFRSFRFDFSILWKILRVGLPAAVQMVITAFSNIFVQSYINVYGSDYMSGWTAYSKVDALLFLPMQSFALASTTFVGQNLGKGLVKRAKSGSNMALLAAAGVTAICMIPILLFPQAIVGFFNDKAQVVEIGSLLLRFITPFYLLCTVNQVYSAALRGAGNSRAPMVIMLASFVLFRQLFLFVISRLMPGNFLAIAFSYPAGWLVCSVASALYYYFTPLKSDLIES